MIFFEEDKQETDSSDNFDYTNIIGWGIIFFLFVYLIIYI